MFDLFEAFLRYGKIDSVKKFIQQVHDLMNSDAFRMLYNASEIDRILVSDALKTLQYDKKENNEH
jgi:hypothetical protein